MKHSKTNLSHLKINTKITNLLIFLSLIILSVAHPIQAADNFVQVSASIPNNYLTLTGYSSPSAKVELESSNTYALTFSDQNGLFTFDKLLLPKNSGELCLTATDANRRKSTPLCLPPLPPFKTSNVIGPILLPPTITLDSEQVDAYSTTFISGESIPNSPVNIHLYQTKDKASLIVKPVQAFSFPSLTTQSDQDGNYSFSVPTTYSSNYRLYSSVNFKDNLSPKSNTLTYLLPSTFSLVTLLLLGLFFIIVILFISLIVLYYRHKEPCQNTITTNH